MFIYVKKTHRQTIIIGFLFSFLFYVDNYYCCRVTMKIIGLSIKKIEHETIFLSISQSKSSIVDDILLDDCLRDKLFV